MYDTRKKKSRDARNRTAVSAREKGPRAKAPLRRIQVYKVDPLSEPAEEWLGLFGMSRKRKALNKVKHDRIRKSFKLNQFQGEANKRRKDTTRPKNKLPSPKFKIKGNSPRKSSKQLTKHRLTNLKFFDRYLGSSAAHLSERFWEASEEEDYLSDSSQAPEQEPKSCGFTIRDLADTLTKKIIVRHEEGKWLGKNLFGCSVAGMNSIASIVRQYTPRFVWYLTKSESDSTELEQFDPPPLHPCNLNAKEETFSNYPMVSPGKARRGENMWLEPPSLKLPNHRWIDFVPRQYRTQWWLVLRDDLADKSRFLGMIPEKLGGEYFANEISGCTYDPKRRLLWLFSIRRMVAVSIPEWLPDDDARGLDEEDLEEAAIRALYGDEYEEPESEDESTDSSVSLSASSTNSNHLFLPQKSEDLEFVANISHFYDRMSMSYCEKIDGLVGIFRGQRIELRSWESVPFQD